MPALVVGFSGCTRSGKGSLVKQLLEHLLGPHYIALTQEPVGGIHRFRSSYGDVPRVVSCICLDHFFLRDKIKKELNGHYDTPEALDHEGILVAASAERSDSLVSWVLVEGFMAFYDARLYCLCHVRIWLELPVAVAWKRRAKTKRVKREYFDLHIWPNHVTYRELVFSRPGASQQIGVLDATQSPPSILPAAVKLLSQLGGPEVAAALELAARARAAAAQGLLEAEACRSPDCGHPRHPDPSVSDGFCCEKCEGRFRGEAWALGGRGKKHTAACTSRLGERGMTVTTLARELQGGPARRPAGEAVPEGGAPSVVPAAASGRGMRYGPVATRRKCAHPDCTFLRNSDPSISRLYCCEKCEGLHGGQAWAKGGKRHYKSCERAEVEETLGGGEDECPVSQKSVTAAQGSSPSRPQVGELHVAASVVQG